MRRRLFLLDVRAIERLRLAAGLTIAELSKTTGFSRSTTYATCRSGKCSIRTARGVAAALGSTLQALLIDPQTGLPLSANIPTLEDCE